MSRSIIEILRAAARRLLTAPAAQQQTSPAEEWEAYCAQQQAQRAKWREERLQNAKRIVAALPPRREGSRAFAIAYENISSEASAQIRQLEGVVVELYGVMTGPLDGSEDFDGFAILTDGEQLTSFRQPQSCRLAIGDFVRIEYLDESDRADLMDEDIVRSISVAR